MRTADSSTTRGSLWLLRFLVVAAVSLAVIGMIHTYQIASVRTLPSSLGLNLFARRGAFHSTMTGNSLVEQDKVKIDPSKWIAPAQANWELSFLTLGDFGATVAQQGAPQPVGPDCNPPLKGWGSRVNMRGQPIPCGTSEWWKQWHAQKNVANLMADTASKMTPKISAVITQGDNFYWDGVMNQNSEMFKVVFEDMYSQPSLNVPWLMCLGNHDVGGSGFICGDDPGTAAMNDLWHRPCNSPGEAAAALDGYVAATRNYKGSGKWTFDDIYFKRTFSAGGITVEVYSLDTNVAGSHGLNEICCQCYGYGQQIPATCAKGKTLADCGGCKNVFPGAPGCAPVDIYNACKGKIESWFKTGIERLQKDLKASTADWKIVTTHYSPLHHFDPNTPDYQTIVDSIGKDLNLWLCGHTHSMSHDYQEFSQTHFIMDGSGGGISAESIGDPLPETGAKRIWTLGDRYGYTSIQVSKNWMKVQFYTFADDYVFGPNGGSGNSKVLYCHYIPVDGGRGCPCTDTSACNSAPAPAPIPTQPPTKPGQQWKPPSEDEEQNQAVVPAPVPTGKTESTPTTVTAINANKKSAASALQQPVYALVLVILLIAMLLSF